ncbi:zf-HC2 domain-containing protein [Streptomyces sp. NPDC004658]|uniref:anti-sigma factor family protein n=1 Tax=Streptomyces sp. NPDC004658 TaxID=3154672 RepID=UPI0033B2E104
MSTTTDTAGHPDVAEISDLTEGLLPPDRSSDVRRHLDGCEACTDVYTSLEEIRDLMGSVPPPEPMPDDVVVRIGAALAAEAPLSAGDEGTAGDVSRETSPSAARPGAHPPLTAADHPADRPAGRPRAGAGPGRKGPQRGRRRGRLVLGAVLTAAVLGAGGLIVTSLGGTSDHTTAHGTPTASAQTFSGDSVQNQVHALLATKKGLPPDSVKPRLGGDGGSATQGSTEGPNTLLQTEVPVPDCVRHALNQSADVLGAKTGTYAGKAAYLVVVADAHDSNRVTAYVVDAACVHQQTASAGTVLLKQSVARH